MTRIPFLSLACTGLLGCASPTPFVRMSSISANPSEYVGKRLTTCGWFESAMELCTLQISRYELASRFWVGTKSRLCSLESAVSPTSSWATITGVVLVGENYGVLGLFQRAFGGATIKLQKAPCDPE